MRLLANCLARSFADHAAKHELGSHSTKANEATRKFNFTHVTKSVLVDPTFHGVQHRDAHFSCNACAVGAGNLRWKWALNHYASEFLWL